MILLLFFQSYIVRSVKNCKFIYCLLILKIYFILYTIKIFKLFYIIIYFYILLNSILNIYFLLIKLFIRTNYLSI